MTQPNGLPAAEIQKLQAFDTCTISNAIERLEVRLRNEGFANSSVRCMIPNLPALVGYAVTGRIRTLSPPISRRCYYDRMDWWEYVASMPRPQVMVLQDIDHSPGVGAFVGEIHAAIGQALGCAGCVTNGAVRDLPAIETSGFHLFAGSVSVSHAYAHIVEFGEPVEVGGLKVCPGDLIHADRHGVLTIPHSAAAEVYETALKIQREEQDLVEFCRSSRFSLEELAERIQRAGAACDQPWRLS